MKGDVIQPASPRVRISNLFVAEMVPDLISTNESRPVPSLFDECTGKHSLFPQFYNTLQYAEPTIQYQNESHEENWCQNLQQQSNRLSQGCCVLDAQAAVDGPSLQPSLSPT